MFLASNPALAKACCRAGIIGCFPALNPRSTDGLVQWLEEMQSQLTDRDAPYGVNLIVHKSNPRFEPDLAQVIKYKVPLVITSLGAAADLVEAVHSYGGLVFHDIVSVRHAEKAAKAGVDGLITVSAGAGGHAGNINPFALVAEVRKVFSGYIALAGCISSGGDVAAARAMGADFGYMGTRFIATQEASVDSGYKQMIVDCSASDVFNTPELSGVPANFMRPSIVQNGLEPDKLKHDGKMTFGEELREAKVWKDIWSAGHGVGAIRDVPSASQLCARLIREYDDCCSELASGHAQ
ncbi:MAG: NAD(P)H-dependent flavin oxidoreductase [Panacagrimonas sp.]